MTTWTNISNAAVAVGGIPSSTTVTALRDNPMAIAESASGAPVVFAGWHPYDKVTVGDGKAGLIYDAAVNGTVANVVTPDFEDGFEYRIIAHGLSHNDTVTNRELTLEFYKQTSASYVTCISFGANSSSAQFGMDATIMMPRITSTWHMASFFAYSGGSLYTTANVVGAYSVTAQKVLRARIDFSVGSIDNGKIWLFRRREYASVP